MNWKNRFQKQSFVDFKFHIKTSVLESLYDRFVGLQHKCFPLKFSKFLRSPFLKEQLQWLLLRFNSCFQRNPEQKPVPLSAIDTRFSWKKVFAAAKISVSVTNLTKGSNFWFFYPFKPFNILNFAMIEWLCHATCFAKVFLLENKKKFPPGNCPLHLPKDNCPPNNCPPHNCPAE